MNGEHFKAYNSPEHDKILRASPLYPPLKAKILTKNIYVNRGVIQYYFS